MNKFMVLTDALDGELLSLTPKRAKEAGQPSPGKVLKLKVDGHEVEFEEWLVNRLVGLIKQDD